jgi:hypothetical protein
MRSARTRTSSGPVRRGCAARASLIVRSVPSGEASSRKSPSEYPGAHVAHAGKPENGSENSVRRDPYLVRTTRVIHHQDALFPMASLGSTRGYSQQKRKERVHVRFYFSMGVTGQYQLKLNITGTRNRTPDWLPT